IDGEKTYPASGELLLTTVSFSSDRLSPLQVLLAWLDPNEDVVAESDFLLPGQTLQQQNELADYAMDSSQLDATATALSAVGDYPEDHAPGALVESTFGQCDAAGKLFPGNVITEINDQPVDDRNEASDLIDDSPRGKPITFTALAGSKQVEVRLKRTKCGPHGETLVGVSLINVFPIDVSIENAGVGGPSAGLMFSLGIYDLLTPGNLTGDRVIAGTGVIGPDGAVYPIGGVEKKVAAAQKAGAQIFFVPKENYEAAKAAKPDIELVPVKSFDEALAALKGDTDGTGQGD
ncbi:MAG: hypothetical protein MUP92_02235, partial [Actinobacteria bacterium]|nr:hypothetical protein [Actinomycetota bacterium]